MSIASKVRNGAFTILNRLLFGQLRIALLRAYGVKIGAKCNIYYSQFSTEHYLIEIGNHVVVSKGVQFLTHDGAVWIFRDKYPDLDLFGPIKIGNNTCIGLNCIILPNTHIGDNCIISAGSVVKGKIPDNSLVMGNPAKVVMKTNMQEKLYLLSPNKIPTKNLSYKAKKQKIKAHFKTE
ncbi:acyltransferase [Carboxylicivirga sediminis]|uniref:Acyltransferase n=1 Tax=Carboxylicivirga sediminis TaxID=2006564 RepID=A0A941F8M0_9BACT|nr:acyltransferase [Carboxylicivirga sediminis]MBR8537484.1 acyltransferase [Carboxylicivirga sediminis]